MLGNLLLVSKTLTFKPWYVIDHFLYLFPRFLPTYYKKTFNRKKDNKYVLFRNAVQQQIHALFYCCMVAIRRCEACHMIFLFSCLFFRPANEKKKCLLSIATLFHYYPLSEIHFFIVGFRNEKKLLS